MDGQRGPPAARSRPADEHPRLRGHTNLSTYAIRDFETKGGQANLRISTQKILDDTLAGAPEDAASWHLLRGSDLHVVHQVISPYLLKLEGIAQRLPAYQGAAARLASQAHRIMGIIALHQSHLKAREHHCKQAMRLAKLTSDVGSRVSALVSLGNAYFYLADPAKAAATYEQVLPLGAAVAPLQRSRVHAELAVVYGQLGREHEALRSVEEAEQLYPDQPQEDPSFLYAEFTRASLTLELGLAYLAMAERNPGRRYPERAAAIFASLDRAHDSDGTPDRVRFEVNNHQANAAIMLDDRDSFEFYLSRGIDGVSQLRSRQRLRELQHAWRRASSAWKGEPRFRELGRRLQVATQGTAVSIEAQPGRS